MMEMQRFAENLGFDAASLTFLRSVLFFLIFACLCDSDDDDIKID